MDAFYSILNRYGIFNEDDFWSEAFICHQGLFSPQEQEKLRQATVAIPGMGGVGGSHLISLVRTGIGRFKIADFDTFEPKNISRQYGARIFDLGRPKVDVLAEEAFKINPFLRMEIYREGINQDNIEAFLEDVDVVVDGVEFFAFEARSLLYNKAKEKGIPVVTAAPLGFNASLLVFDPQTSPSFEEYFAIKSDMSLSEKALLFALGLAPKPFFLRYLNFDDINLKAQRGPASVITCYLCSALAAIETVRLLLNRPGIRPVPYYLQLDIYLKKLYLGYLPKGNKNLKQKLKYWFLKKKLGLD